MQPQKSPNIHPLLALTLTLLLLITTASLQAVAPPDTESSWIYYAPVTFDDHYDGAHIDLVGHPPIYVDNVVYYSGLYESEPVSPLQTPRSLVYESATELKKGQELRIAYSAKTGPVLLDPSLASGKYIEIISGLEQHPLDMLYELKLGHGSTAEEVVAANKMVVLWEAEISRIYDRLRTEFPDEKEVFDNAQEQWEIYCEADNAARNVTYDKDGTIWSIVAARDRIALYRSHALRLAKWGRY
jgi:hypothetical protein